MSRQVPDFIDPIRAAEGEVSIAGQLAFSRMKRLLEVVNNREGSAEVSLNFAVDGQGIPCVEGRVRAEVLLTCQRCLEPMQFAVDVDVHLGIVAGEDAEQRLPERYEPLLMRGEQLLIAETVEDEIFLALPSVPRHDPAECVATEHIGQRQNDDGEREGDASAGPFAILAQLKAKR